MFERFTQPARTVVVHAQEEARALHHAYLGTEHLLLGILREGTGTAARVLDLLGFDLVSVRSEVVRLVGSGPGFDESDADLLRAIGIDLDEVRHRVEETFGPGALDRRARTRRRRGRRCESDAMGRIPFTPRAKKALELSMREAIRLGSQHIGTEHLLLGLIREGDGIAAQILQARGATQPTIWAAIIAESARRDDPPGASA